MSDRPHPRPPTPSATAMTRLQKLRITGGYRPPISRPPARASGLRQARQSFSAKMIPSSIARRRRLLRGSDRRVSHPALEEDDWSSDSGSVPTHPSSTRSQSPAGVDSSGSDTANAVVDRARSTRLARGIGTIRVVSNPIMARRRFPSVASSFGLSPIRQHAPTPVSSPIRGRIPSFSPLEGRTRLESFASETLATTPATHPSTAWEPDFPAPSPTNEDGNSSFLMHSEQDTISFIYEPAVISDAFSKGIAASPESRSTLPTPSILSPLAAPFVFICADGEDRGTTSTTRGRLSADKAETYAVLSVVSNARKAGTEYERMRLETVKEKQESGAGGAPIPVMVGPESLPYARNPSGVDGSVLDSAGRLNVWTRSAEDPEPEHIDHLHFQRRPGALNPSTRVLADDDLQDSAYSCPADYAVPCAGYRPIFKAARPRCVEGMHHNGEASPLPSPLPLHYPILPPLSVYSQPSIGKVEGAQATSWLDPPSTFYDRRSCQRSQENIALQDLLGKLQATSSGHYNPSDQPVTDGVWSPDMAFSTPCPSLLSSSPPSSMGLTSTPFSSLPSIHSSPAYHLPPGVYSSNGGSPPMYVSEGSVAPAMQQRPNALFRSRLANFSRPFHDPTLIGEPNLPAPWFAPGQTGPPLQTASPAAPPGLQTPPPLVTAPRATTAVTGLLPAAEIAPRASRPRQIGRRDSDPIACSSGTPQLYPPDSTVSVTSERPGSGDNRVHGPGTSSLPGLDRCDDAIFLPAGVGRGFADGGARRPGPRVKAAPRSLGRRALDSMEVAAGRERQSSVLEKERLAVLASCEPDALTLPAPVVVVGELRARVTPDKLAKGGNTAIDDRPQASTRLKRSARASFPAGLGASAKSTMAPIDDVLSVGSLTTMFCDDATPSPSAAAVLRRAEQRRIVSEPVRRSQLKVSSTSAGKASLAQGLNHRSSAARPSDLAAEQTAATSVSASVASGPSSRRPKRQRGGRPRATSGDKSTGRK